MNDPTKPRQDDPTDRSSSASPSKKSILKVWPLYETKGAAPVKDWQIALIDPSPLPIVLIKVFHLNRNMYAEGWWLRTIARRAGLCAATGVDILPGVAVCMPMCEISDPFPNVEMILASEIEALLGNFDE